MKKMVVLKLVFFKDIKGTRTRIHHGKTRVLLGSFTSIVPFWFCPIMDLPNHTQIHF